MKKTVKNRRRSNQTDYGKRLKLLKSGRPRMVYRSSNKLVTAQYVVSDEARDKVIKGVTSKDLVKFEWDAKNIGGLKSLTASYLTAYLIGKQIIKEKLEMPIVDSGMTKTLYGSRFYAFIKGLIDAGLEINCKEEAFPSNERINGEHLKNKVDVEKIKSNIDKL